MGRVAFVSGHVPTVTVEIEARNLPGRSCRPDPSGVGYENVHVGPGLRGQAIDLVPADADEARWFIPVQAVTVPDGALDFKGALVQGGRGNRFLYLNWGTVAAGGSFTLFRRAKIFLSDLPAELPQQALVTGEAVVATIDTTDARGNPICGRVLPPAIEWSLGTTTPSQR